MLSQHIFEGDLAQATCEGAVLFQGRLKLTALPVQS